MTSRKERHKQRRQTERLLEEAHEALAAGERALAGKLAARAVARGPMNPMVWYEAAQVLLGLGKTEEAEQALRSALRIAPGLDDAARALAGLGREVPAAGATPARPGVQEPAPAPPTARTERYDWPAVEAELAARGCERLERLLSGEECASLAGLDGGGAAFLGAGRRDDASGRFSWQYFMAPLPAPLAGVEAELFARLGPLADRRQELLGREERFGSSLAAFQERCADAGQILPGAKRIECEPGGFLGPARELPGRRVFPLQALVALGPGAGSSRFVLADDRPGRRERTVELELGVGDAALSWSNERLVVVGGAVGLQPVLWRLAPCPARTAFLFLPFHLVA